MKFIKSMKTKALAVFTVLCMLAGSAGVYANTDTAVRGSESVSFSVSISVAEGSTPPENYGVDINVVDKDKNVNAGDLIDSTTSSKTINLNNLAADDQVVIQVRSAGMGIRMNGVEVTSEEWSEGKTFSLNEINTKDLAFELFSSGENPPEENRHSGYENGTATSSKLVFTKGTSIDFYVNDSTIVNYPDPFNGNNVPTTVGYKYYFDEDKASTVDFYLNTFINQRYTKIEINGTDYVGKLPDPNTDEGKQAMLDACIGQLYEYKITVPYAEEYTISATKENLENGSPYLVVGNFKWTYDENHKYMLDPDGNPIIEDGKEKLNDDFIDHGSIELIKVQLGKTVYEGESLSNKLAPDSAFSWSDASEDSEGNAVLPAGALITVKLVPQYGYQLTSFGVNGGEFKADKDKPATYSFTIKGGNFHLGARFTPVDDVVVGKSEFSDGASLKLNNSAIDSGSAVVTVEDAPVENIEGFNSAMSKTQNLDGYEVRDVLEISMEQVWYKGTETEYWSKQITEMGDSTATVTLTAPKQQTGIQVLHERHDGGYEVLRGTEYDAENGTVTFTTDSFSRFALAYKGTSIDEKHVQINYNPWPFGDHTKADVNLKVGNEELNDILPSEGIDILKGELVTVTVVLPDERKGEAPIAEIRYFEDSRIEKVDVVKNMTEVSDGVFEFELPSETDDYANVEIEVFWSEFDYLDLQVSEDEYLIHTIIHDQKDWGIISFETKEKSSVSLSNETKYFFNSGAEEASNVMKVTPKPGYLLMDVIIDNVIGYFNYDNQDFEGTKYSLASVLENGSYLIPVEIKMSTTTVEMFFTKCEEHHAADTVTGYKAPTCTEEGYSGDKLCTECGEVAVKGKAIAAKGHSYEKHVCAVCNELETGYTYYEFADGSGKEANKATGFKDTQTTIVSGAGKKYIAVDVVLTYEDEPTKEYKTDVTIKSDTEKLVTDYNKETGILYVTLENYRHIGIKAVLTVNGLSKTLTLRWSPKQPEIVTEVALGTLEVPVQNQVTSVAEIVLNSIIAGNIESQSESPIQLSATIGELSALMSAPTIKINTTVRSEPVTDSKVLLPGGMRENKVIGALDITLPVFVNDTEVGKLTKLDKPIDITVALPELPKVQKGYRRIFEVCREHEGTVEKIPANIDANGDLVITSALYSEYVITYRDELITETPSKPSVDTSDHSQNVLWMALMLASAVAAVGIFCFRKRCN